MELNISLSFVGIVGLVGLIIVAMLGFIIGWKFSNFLIPPIDYWTKSGATMFATKFGIAIGSAYFAVWGFAALISAFFG